MCTAFVIVLFALGFLITTSDTNDLSEGATCTCNNNVYLFSTLICSLATASDFVKVKSDYCGVVIKVLKLNIHVSTHLSSSILPDIGVSRLKITGAFLNEVSGDTFNGSYKESLRFLEIIEGGLTAIPTGALQHILHLETLNLAGNSIKFVDCTGVFLEHKSMKTLKLDDNEITTLTLCSFPESISTLSLKNNRIEYLSRSLNWLKNLRLLFIQRNRITSLEGELEDLENLSILHAAWNRITHIGREIIQLPELRSLDLSHNLISQLGDSLFGLQKLYSLDLSYNEFEDFYQGDFAGAEQLIILNLSRNRIHYLEDDVFQRLMHLEILRISHNLIVTLEGRLNALTSLKILDASHNDIRTIDKTFTNLILLEELNLRRNEIAELGDSLDRLSQLKSLDLAYNELEELNEYHLARAKNLEKLDLSHNIIGPFRGRVFVPLTKLSTLDLSYNLIQSMNELIVPGFMNITIPKKGTMEGPENCNCKMTKFLSLKLTHFCRPESEAENMTEILRKNGIELIGC